jgi:hypothetical protein
LKSGVQLTNVGASIIVVGVTRVSVATGDFFDPSVVYPVNVQVASVGNPTGRCRSVSGADAGTLAVVLKPFVQSTSTTVDVPVGTVPFKNSDTSGWGPYTDIVWNVGARVSVLGICVGLGGCGLGCGFGDGLGDGVGGGIDDGVVTNDGDDFFVT